MEEKNNNTKIMYIKDNNFQYLYEKKFSQTFANFGSQKRALEDLFIEIHSISYEENVSRKEKEKDFNYLN